MTVVLFVVVDSDEVVVDIVVDVDGDVSVAVVVVAVAVVVIILLLLLLLMMMMMMMMMMLLLLCSFVVAVWFVDLPGSHRHPFHNVSSALAHQCGAQPVSFFCCENHQWHDYAHPENWSMQD